MGCPPSNKTLSSIKASKSDDDLILVSESLRTIDLIADKQVISRSSFFNLNVSLLFVVLSPTLRLIRQLNLVPPGEWSCGLCGVGIRSLVSIYPFCMVVIFSELTKSRESKSLSGSFLLLFPWMSAILISLPVYWTYNYDTGSQNAMQRIGFRMKFLFIFKPIPTNIPLHLIRRVRFPPIILPVVEKPDKIVGISFSIVFLVQTIFQPFLYFITVYDTPLCDYLQNIMSALVSEEIGGARD
ncbi:hypothetical protein Fcan01_24862 [Folsomia candida]|uniref:Uncharacterized protein n=1 Tax=Folsomia candida TaxID=158441 RepID=A0A226D426_FOLCA|nr:hypothetical protein Fcan01_24862 [Folsomia candida]